MPGILLSEQRFSGEKLFPSDRFTDDMHSKQEDGRKSVQWGESVIPVALS